MTARISNVPLGVDVAIAQRELKADRREIRDSRALLDAQRIRLGQEQNETGYVVEAVGASVEAMLPQMKSGIEDEQSKDTANQVGESIRRAIQEASEQVRQDGARIRNLETGEDVAGESLAKTSTKLAKLRRPRGST